MLTISLQAESVEEMKAKIQALSGLFSLGVTGSNPVSPTTQVQPIAIETAKRGRTAKADTRINSTPKTSTVSEPETVKEVQETPAPEAVAPVEVKVSKQEITALLQELNIKKGLPKAREVLKDFGCQRLSEIKEADYAAFAAACQAALKA